MPSHPSLFEEHLFHQEQNSHERAIARAILDGQKDAFDYFIQRYSSPLSTYIAHILSDQELAADVLQNVFLRLYLALPHLNLEKPLKPWLFQVAHNYCIDELRWQRRHKTSLFSTLLVQDEETSPNTFLEIEDTQANTEVLCEQHDLQETFQKVLALLPVRARDVVVLRYTSNLTFSQIGQLLQMPEATAKTCFRRARKRLKTALIKEGILTRDTDTR